MKKHMFLVALAATMGLASCSNEENVVPAADNHMKSVTIKIANAVAGTRSADLTAAGTKATLNNFQVFFADASGNLYQGSTVDAEGVKQATAQEHFFTLGAGGTDLGEFNANSDNKTYTFHFLPSQVDRVVVIGNLEKEIDVTTVTTLKAVEDLVETKYTAADAKLDINTQQNDADLYLYGIDANLTSKAEDAFGHPRYQAVVNLTPRVARIEIAGFNYKQVDDVTARLYKSIQVEQVVFGNYYPYATKYDAAASGEIVLKDDDVDPSTVFNLFDNQEDLADNMKWRNDFLGGTNTLPAVDLTGATQGATTWLSTFATERPAYNFFANGEEKPQLLVKLLVTDKDGNTIPMYLATTGFVANEDDAESAITKDQNKVYVVSFEFDDNDLLSPEKCIDVKVNVTDWVVTPVIPEF